MRMPCRRRSSRCIRTCRRLAPPNRIFAEYRSRADGASAVAEALASRRASTTESESDYRRLDSEAKRRGKLAGARLSALVQ